MTASFPNMSKPLMAQLHPLTLSFRNPEVERAFASHLVPRLRVQGRAAIVFGTFVYLLSGFLDRLLVPQEYQLLAWVFRLSALAYAGLSSRSPFTRPSSATTACRSARPDWPSD